MKRAMILMTLITLAFAAGCGGDDKDAASDAAANLQEKAGDMMNQAEETAGSMAQDAETMAQDAAGSVATSAVEACQQFAEAGAWENALEVCAKAHEMMPDDLGLEHAYQQAKAAAEQ